MLSGISRMKGITCPQRRYLCFCCKPWPASRKEEEHDHGDLSDDVEERQGVKVHRETDHDPEGKQDYEHIPRPDSPLSGLMKKPGG